MKEDDRQTADGRRQTGMDRRLAHVCRLPVAGCRIQPRRRPGSRRVRLRGRPAGAEPLAGRSRVEDARRHAAVTGGRVRGAAGSARARQRRGRATFQQKNKTFLPHVVAVPAGSTVALPERRCDFPQRVLAVAAAAVRPGAVSRRGVEAAGVREARRASRVLQHPSADVGVSGRRPTPYRDRGRAGRHVAPGGAARQVSRDGALGARRAGDVVEVTVCGAGDRRRRSRAGRVRVPRQHRTRNKFGKPYPKDAYRP